MISYLNGGARGTQHGPKKKRNDGVEKIGQFQQITVRLMAMIKYRIFPPFRFVSPRPKKKRKHIPHLPFWNIHANTTFDSRREIKGNCDIMSYCHR